MSLYRIVLLGDGGVGKSCITVQFTQNYFVKEYDPTIENSYRKQIQIDNEACVVDVLDTAGQEEYAVMRDQYINSGQGFLVCFSVTNRSTFNSVHPIIEQILNVKDVEKFPMVLVGNKCDLTDERTVSTEEGKSAAEKHGGIPFFEASAKARLNVEECFYALVREIRKYESQTSEDTSNSGGDKPKQKKNPIHKMQKLCILL